MFYGGPFLTRTRSHGFTLIEAAVAIAVVAILSGIIVPLVVKNLQDSQIARAKNDIQVIAAALASQLKDTGCRPSQAAGPGGSSGVLYRTWGSGGVDPALTGGGGATAENTFANLFTVGKTDATAQVLFFGSPTPLVTSANELSYKGPYLGSDAALKSDPWGSRYLITGYNARGQEANGPIWVVCAGPDKAILGTNISNSSNPLNTWTATGISADDIVMRVN
jgi:prepilin-type N-terminal cleavage/methylation domain-containing protein